MSAEQASTPISKSRLEALSDGLFAIVLTLLVFQLMTPLILEAKSTADLHAALIELWPRFVSFTISFTIISIYWVGHHSYYHALRGINETQLWLNLFFLFFVSIIPFSSELIGEHHNTRAAGIIYGLNLATASCALRVNWWYASSRQLVRTDIDRAIIQQIHKRGIFSVISSLVVAAIAWFNPVVAFYLYVVNAFGYLVLQIYGQSLRRTESSNQGIE